MCLQSFSLKLMRALRCSFSVEEFEDAGLTAEDRFLIEFMAWEPICKSTIWIISHQDSPFRPGSWVRHCHYQHVGGALLGVDASWLTLLSQSIGADHASKQCIYQYPYTTVQELVLFCQLLFVLLPLSRLECKCADAGRTQDSLRRERSIWILAPFGLEAECPNLAPKYYDGRTPANDLPAVSRTLPHCLFVRLPCYTSSQSFLVTDMSLLYPWISGFETRITQSYAWTLLSPYVKSCPSNNPHIEFVASGLLFLFPLSYFFNALATSSTLSLQDGKTSLLSTSRTNRTPSATLLPSRRTSPSPRPVVSSTLPGGARKGYWLA